LKGKHRLSSLCFSFTFLITSSSYPVYHCSRTHSTKEKTPKAMINPSKTAFFCCDIQERFRPLISYFPSVVAVASTMVCQHFPFPTWMTSHCLSLSLFKSRVPMSNPPFFLPNQVKASQVFKCPLFVTEQYPEALGKTYDFHPIPASLFD
jgi:hypothetical protein